MELSVFCAAINYPTLNISFSPESHCVIKRSYHGWSYGHSLFYLYGVNLVALFNYKINLLSAVCSPEVEG